MGYADTHFAIKDGSSCLGGCLMLVLIFMVLVLMVLGLVIYVSFRLGRIAHLYTLKWTGRISL